MDIQQYTKFLNGNFLGSFSNFSNLNLGPEVLFFILAVIFILLWGLSLGRTRAFVSLLAIYIAYVLETGFPYLSQVNSALNLKYDTAYVKIGLFFAIYILVFAILNSSLVKKRLTIKESSIVIVGLVSLLQLGLLISIISNSLPSLIIKQVPAYLLPFFLGQQALFIWFVLPIVAALFIKRD